MRTACAILTLLITACATAPAPKTERYTVLMLGNPAGEQTTTILPNGERRYHFTFTDRGRGPKIDSVVRLDAKGFPVHFHATGTDYLKNPVDEQFDITGSNARWKNYGVETTLPATEPRFYVGIESAPEELANLARVLLASADRCANLYPSGRACIEKVQTVIASEPITQYAITGLAFEPNSVWLNSDHEFYAIASSWLTVIRAGSESFEETLVRKEEDETSRRRAAMVSQLRHRPTRPLVIRNARVFDARTGSVQDGMVVIIEGDRIVGVEHDAGVVPPPNAEIIDARGRMLLPGLWDMHSHGTEGLLNLAAGVTSVRSMGDDFESITRMRRETDEGTVIGPRVVMAGLIDGSGPYKISTAIADTEEQAQALIDRYAAAGFQSIKIYSSIKPELVPFLVRYSHEKGLRISGHIPAGMFAEDLVRLGFDEIQHTNMLFLNFYKDVTDTRTPLRFTAVGDRGADLDLQSPEVRSFIALLKERNVVIDPTLGAFQGLLMARPGKVNPTLAAVIDRLPVTVQRFARSGGLPVDAAKDVRYTASFRRIQDFVAELWRNGITLVAGTDNMPGFTLHHELELWVDAGIPAPDVLRIATLGAAQVAKRDADLGTIEAGKLADLILVDGDPTKDIRHIRRVVTTIKNGEVYDTARLYGAVGVLGE